MDKLNNKTTKMIVDVIYSNKRRQELEDSDIRDCKLVQHLSERVLLASGATQVISHFGRNFADSKGDITFEAYFPYKIKSSEIENKLKHAGDYAIRTVIAREQY
jgi:hypothetical protein